MTILLLAAGSIWAAMPVLVGLYTSSSTRLCGCIGWQRSLDGGRRTLALAAHMAGKEEMGQNDTLTKVSILALRG